MRDRHGMTFCNERAEHSSFRRRFAVQVSANRWKIDVEWHRKLFRGNREQAIETNVSAEQIVVLIQILEHSTNKRWIVNRIRPEWPGNLVIRATLIALRSCTSTTRRELGLAAFNTCSCDWLNVEVAARLALEHLRVFARRELHSALACANAHKHANVEINRKRKHRLDVTSVHDCCAFDKAEQDSQRLYVC